MAAPRTPKPVFPEVWLLRRLGKIRNLTDKSIVQPLIEAVENVQADVQKKQSKDQEFMDAIKKEKAVVNLQQTGVEIPEFLAERRERYSIDKLNKSVDVLERFIEQDMEKRKSSSTTKGIWQEADYINQLEKNKKDNKTQRYIIYTLQEIYRTYDDVLPDTPTRKKIKEAIEEPIQLKGADKLEEPAPAYDTSEKTSDTKGQKI